jgi:hypothetical protein
VVERTVALDAARAVAPGGQAQAAHALLQRKADAGQHDGLDKAAQRDGHEIEKPEQGEGEICARDPAGRPQRRPDALPQDRGPCQRDMALRRARAGDYRVG